ncbi:hypothetical protein AKJ09_01637 [Labilithrix luteola]|uniref:Uncharacterized protein n=1 Tax=Labilithrix luteola TaxID=1391654 RepID=A0A0K1PN67_9BACT|nr:hypothetical protein [Labilithrix luteola]AKU94973.1 hypothetical protein AKJ09_01637 [Labilithrix luteola]
MTKDTVERPAEPTVQFLNVDVDVSGVFDRAVLLAGFGDSIDVLFDGEAKSGESVVSFELRTATPTFPDVISGLIALVRALPDDARAAWDGANRRIFDIGIQAGLHPHSSNWSLTTEIMAALVSIDAEVRMTVYRAAAV